MKTINLLVGTSIQQAINQAKQLSAKEGDVVGFKFNDVPVRVLPSTNTDALVWDYHNFQSLGVSHIGPYSAAHVSGQIAVRLQEHRCRSAQLGQQAAQQARQEQADAKAMFDNLVIGTQFSFASPQAKYFFDGTLLAAEGPYDRRSCTYAIDWGRATQALVGKGYDFERAFKAAEDVADYDGITGFMASRAKSLLLKVWKYAPLVPKSRS